MFIQIVWHTALQVTVCNAAKLGSQMVCRMFVGTVWHAALNAGALPPSNVQPFRYQCAMLLTLIHYISEACSCA